MTSNTERFSNELSELKAQASHTPGQLRRIAELVELLDGSEASIPCWERAIGAGDELAISALQDIRDEATGKTLNYEEEPSDAKVVARLYDAGAQINAAVGCFDVDGFLRRLGISPSDHS